MRGTVTGTGDLRIARALARRTFEESEGGAYVEREGAGMPGAAIADPLPGRSVLLCADGVAWSVEDPGGWPPIADLFGAAVESPRAGEGLLPPPALTVRLARTDATGARSGILGRAGGGSRLAQHLAALGADLDELRLGEAEGGWWWLFAPRGVPRAVPSSAGRPLRNLGTGLEPVLVPADRLPAPALSALRIRRLFGVAEGEGLLWWDEEDGERHVHFQRSGLAALDLPFLASRRW